jgi:hypothetical protein
MAQDVVAIANETAQQRVEDGNPAVVEPVATHSTANGVTSGATNGVNGASKRKQYKPDSFIEVEDHVLLEPTRKTKVISIGCGFSGNDILASTWTSQAPANMQQA